MREAPWGWVMSSCRVSVAKVGVVKGDGSWGREREICGREGP